MSLRGFAPGRATLKICELSSSWGSTKRWKAIGPGLPGNVACADLTALIRRTEDLLPGLKSVSLNTGNLTALAAGLATVTALANRLGVNVKERNAPLPDG